MAKTKNFSNFLAIFFVFWANISAGLGDPLGCSDLSQIFFGSSPIATEWDKIVAKIIHTTFVFLRHPKGVGGAKQICAIYSSHFPPGHPAYTVVIFPWTSCIYNCYFPKPPCIYSSYFPLTPCICSFFFHLDTLYTQLLFFPGHPVCI